MSSLADVYGRVAQDNPERAKNDFYPTAPWVTFALMETEGDRIPDTVWEPAAGRGWMAAEIAKHKRTVEATDLYRYDNPLHPTTVGIDFLKTYQSSESGPMIKGIITNPPYAKNQAEKFIKHALHALECPYLAVVCRLTFMEGMGRYKMFTQNPPTRVYALSTRFSADEEMFTKKPSSGMIAYAWFIWDYQNGHTTDTQLKWIDGKDMVNRWKRRESSSAEAATSQTEAS
jgi:hypothetical protein